MKGLISVVSLLAVSAVANGPHWTYEGEHGPKSWSKLDEKFAACSDGKNQSPIDLKWKLPKESRDVKFEYGPSVAKILDNGHTIQANFAAGNKIKIEGKEYELLQMHFHASSEHTFSGKGYPLELHLVHKNAEGKLAVLGVMFEEGLENEALASLWSQIPIEKEKEVEFKGKLDPTLFIPKKLTHYHYVGSLTTPPCSEGVNWNVLNTPLTASKAQLERFRTIYTGNNRPIQPWNDRRPANF